ncbi:hypothetical protein [Rufibacter psychrotolerans]|uniref:hypothetical protein n=1 Tax=Rufibacter psychrotolerans TaxID=2812556 RepID=UPI001966D172|nr:hypothetical protein [Rufibacter sp. SYSU D00308]
MKSIAAKGMVLLFGLTIVFHLLVLASVIPYTIVGGGRITTQEEMYQLETAALALNVLFFFISLLQAGYLRLNVSPRLLTGAMWGMFGVFLLNTVGNLFSNSPLEKLIFTPVTLILAVFSVILAVSPGNRTV